MKRFKVFAVVLWICVMVLGLTGCYENTTVVSTSGILGGDGRAILIDTDNPNGVTPTIVDSINSPKKMIHSPDGTKVYTFSSGLSDARNISIINLETKTSSTITVPILRYIWDMALSSDGSKLFVGTRNPVANYVEIYDTTTETWESSVMLGIDFLFGQKLVISPVKEEIYTIETFSIFGAGKVRAYDFSGNKIGEGAIAAPLFEANYDLAISPDSQLLIAVSDIIYPFKVLNTGSSILDPLTPLDAEDDPADEAKFNGKTNILFPAKGNMVYIASAGVHVLASLTNLAGSLVCLDTQKVLNDNPDPYLFVLTDFINDELIHWIIEDMLDIPILNVILPGHLYGIADACVQGDTLYFVISSVVNMAVDLIGLPGGTNVLAAISIDPIFGLPWWQGGKVLDKYPNSIAVNSENDALAMTYFWQREVGIYKKNISWLFTGETVVDLTTIVDASTAFPRAAALGRVEK